MRVPESGHEAVMLGEVLELMALAPGKVIVDGTTGRAGHALEMAAKVGASGLLVGLDVDERTLQYAKEKLADAPCAVRPFHAKFAELGGVLDDAGVKSVDGLLAYLGV